MPATHQSVVVNAPIDVVWEKFSDFHDMPWAANVLSSNEKVGDKGGSEVGAKRILNDAFHETLMEYNDTEHRIRYSIDDGPSPVSRQEVSNYIGTLQLFPVTQDNTTFVAWSSSWLANSNAGVEFCQPIYSTLLQELSLILCSE